MLLDGAASRAVEGREVTSYEWDLGDGRVLEGVTATAVYEEPGRHAITLRVFDEAGRCGDTTRLLNVVCKTSDRGDGVGDACEPPGGVLFLRGDVDGSGDVPGTTADMVRLADFLFFGANAPPCLAAADVNGDGSVPGSTTDIVFLANFLFLGGAEPPAPGPRECGTGTEADEQLGCETPPECARS